MKCTQLGEFGLIARIAKQIPRSASVVVGVGDDAAVLRWRGNGRYLLFKTDPVVEGTHFVFGKKGKQACATSYQVGWKAMARNLSDIAAMGGIPRWAVVSLGLPADADVELVDGIYRGLNAAAAQFDTVIVGGDISQIDGPLFVSVSLVGEVEKRYLKLRSAARAGQMAFVTGALGGSSCGKHLTFMPRLKEARWLVKHFPIKAMMDISDGLGSDLRRIAESSGVGFDIVAQAVPVSTAARKLSRQTGTSELRHAWGDGEDFELLFTLPAASFNALLQRWYSEFQLPLNPIGMVTGSAGRIRLLNRDGIEITEAGTGYEHFKHA